MIGRAGLAVLGALSALFVAALVGKADIDGINCLAALLGSVLYACLGFYLGIDIPALPPELTAAHASERGDLLLLLSAVGTLVASLAALLSLSVFVFEASPAVTCVLAIGVAWFFGVTMQLVAGSLGRILHWAVREEFPRMAAARRIAADRS
jgi:hypothetical protein